MTELTAIEKEAKQLMDGDTERIECTVCAAPINDLDCGTVYEAAAYEEGLCVDDYEADNKAPA